MKLFLPGCIIFVLLLMVIAVMRLRRPQQQATRYRPKRESKVLSPPEDKVFVDSFDRDDPDIVLGLKKEPEATQAASETGKLAYLVLHVMAPPNESYGGYELLQALLANNLRFDAADRLFHACREA